MRDKKLLIISLIFSLMFIQVNKVEAQQPNKQVETIKRDKNRNVSFFDDDNRFLAKTLEMAKYYGIRASYPLREEVYPGDIYIISKNSYSDSYFDSDQYLGSIFDGLSKDNSLSTFLSARIKKIEKELASSEEQLKQEKNDVNDKITEIMKSYEKEFGKIVVNKNNVYNLNLDWHKIKMNKSDNNDDFISESRNFIADTDSKISNNQILQKDNFDAFPKNLNDKLSKLKVYVGYSKNENLKTFQLADIKKIADASDTLKGEIEKGDIENLENYIKFLKDKKSQYENLSKKADRAKLICDEDCQKISDSQGFTYENFLKSLELSNYKRELASVISDSDLFVKTETIYTFDVADNKTESVSSNADIPISATGLVGNINFTGSKVNDRHVIVPGIKRKSISKDVFSNFYDDAPYYVNDNKNIVIGGFNIPAEKFVKEYMKRKDFTNKNKFDAYILLAEKVYYVPKIDIKNSEHTTTNLGGGVKTPVGLEEKLTYTNDETATSELNKDFDKKDIAIGYKGIAWKLTLKENKEDGSWEILSKESVCARPFPVRHFMVHTLPHHIVNIFTLRSL
jgi:hypothetical protein